MVVVIESLYTSFSQSQLGDVEVWMTNEHLLKVAIFRFCRHGCIFLDRFVQITERSGGLRDLEWKIGSTREVKFQRGEMKPDVTQTRFVKDNVQR